MKNIFKSLMLVAVAAMAFTACQNEPEYVAENGGETIEIRVEAGVDDTRVYFGNKVLNYYAAYWHGTETVNGFLCEGKDGSGAEHYDAVELTSEIAGDNRVFFDLKFTDVKDVKDGVVKLNVGYNKSFTVPTAQTPLADSVDPAAMFLSGEASFSNGAYENLLLDLGFDTAYGKMTVKNVAGDIEELILTLDDKKYNLNPENVENGVFWFACDACTPKKASVSIVADYNLYVKELDLTAAENPFKFEKGTVSTFAVNFAGVEADPNAYLVQYETDKLEAYGVSAYFEGSHGWKLVDSESNSQIHFVLNRLNTPTLKCFKPGTYTKSSAYKDPSNKQTIEETCVFIEKYTTDGSNYTYNSGITSASMTITFVEATATEAAYYQIIVNANGDKFGFRGMPEGFISFDDFEPVTLAAPEGLVADPEYNNITLSWNSVAGADYYELYLGNPAGASNAKGIRVDGTSYTHTGYDVDPGVTQQWTVRAVSNYPAERLTSAWSSPLASFVYPEEPVQLDAPTVSVKAGSDAEYGSVTIQWNAVNNADYYAVYDSAAANATPVATITATEYTYTYSDLNAGTAYLWVRAMSDGSAINSELAQVTFTVPEKSQGGEVTIPEGYAKLDSIALGSASYNSNYCGFLAAFSYVNANSEKESGNLIYWAGGNSTILKEGTYTWAQYPDYSGTGLAFKIQGFRHNGLKTATSGEMKVEGKLLTFSFTAEGTEYKYYHILE
ncbi:MAG: hypothetical protein IKA81_00325 [Alistipes sp.]|nr:hypothetical protein [Alistipes sp.]